MCPMLNEGMTQMAAPDRCLQSTNNFPKLINDSSSLNKGNHDCDSVWISDLNQHIRFYDFISLFSP